MTGKRSRGGLGGVLGVVVTYNPGPDLAKALAALRGQVGSLVVVDNGSDNFAAVERVAMAARCRVVANRVNLGVASALSHVARIAQAEGFDWLAMFDQDSSAPDGGIGRLLAFYNDHPQSDRIGILAMSHRDRATGRDYHQGWDVLEEGPGWRSVRTTITSGSMVKVEVFGIVGFFDEELFIDFVDHDFCLRCRAHGFLVIEDRAVAIDHSIGDAMERSLLGRRVVCFNHAPERRYYITRNQLEVCVRYLRVDAVWALLGLCHLAGASLIVLLYEQRRVAKLGAMFEGGGDFILRRFGPRRRRRPVGCGTSRDLSR
jgi:rhamnosyltransferase